MSNYQIINAADNWQRYIDIFNRHTIFAPYTIPISMSLVENHILKMYDDSDQLVLIGKNLNGEGIIHVGCYKPDSGCDAGKEMGLIFVLMGDNNNITEYLLRKAEEWFKEKKVNLVRACNWRPNPYMYILHGAETYLWGGNVAAINAFRRVDYDLTLESVIMICDHANELEIPVLDIPELEFKEMELLDSELVYKSDIKAFIDGKEAGHCTYYYLKSISSYFKKPIGQIAISIEADLYGKGLGQALLISAHSRLYKMGAQKVMLHTSQSLFRAIRLYEKTGYKEQNIRGFCYEKEFLKDF